MFFCSTVLENQLYGKNPHVLNRKSQAIEITALNLLISFIGEIFRLHHAFLHIYRNTCFIQVWPRINLVLLSQKNQCRIQLSILLYKGSLTYSFNVFSYFLLYTTNHIKLINGSHEVSPFFFSLFKLPWISVDNSSKPTRSQDARSYFVKIFLQLIR